MNLGPSLLSCDSIFLSLSLLVCGMGIARLTSQGSCEQQKGAWSAQRSKREALAVA